MPTLLNIFGLRFYFYSDEHLPIHVHVENADGRAKINIEPTTQVVENRHMKSKDLKRAISTIELYREDFIKAWKEYHGE
jgi:hypothetical protein